MSRRPLPQAPSRYDQRLWQIILRDIERSLQTATGGGTTTSVEVTTDVHNDLTGRDAPNSHPLDAITGLIAALDGKASDFDLTQLESRVTQLEGESDVATLTTLIDDTGAANPQVLYVGKAVPGTAEATAAWQIKRITIESDDDAQIEFAGTGAFDQAWVDRTTLTYS
jgi:hypothetical protein